MFTATVTESIFFKEHSSTVLCYGEDNKRLLIRETLDPFHRIKMFSAYDNCTLVLNSLHTVH